MTIVQRIQAAIAQLPMWVQKAAVDAFETGVSAGMIILGGQALYVPHNFSDFKAEAIAVGTAVWAGAAGAAVSAIRRAVKAHFAE